MIFHAHLKHLAKRRAKLRVTKLWQSKFRMSHPCCPQGNPKSKPVHTKEQVSSVRQQTGWAPLQDRQRLKNINQQYSEIDNSSTRIRK